MTEPMAVVRRRAARVILVDPAGRVLLLHGYDPARPDHMYWFTVGGGLNDGETPAQGAARELAEETGLAVEPARLGEPVFHDTTEFPFGGRMYQQEQDFFALRVPDFAVRTDGLDAVERASIDGSRWWPVEDLIASGEQFYPPRLPEVVRFILGECGILGG